MDIRNSIAKWVLKGYSYLTNNGNKGYFPDFNEARQPFAQTIFLNIVELLTDLVQDTTLILKAGDPMRFADFNVFFLSDGQMTLNRLFNKGVAVIAYNAGGFSLLDENQYSNNAAGMAYATDPKYIGSRIYVLKSDAYRMEGKSDRQLLNGFIEYLENVMNASNTTTARLGSMIMAVPVSSSASRATETLLDTEREKLEKDVSDNFGGLRNQRQIRVWPQQMAFTTINLAGLDSKTIDKAKLAINVICDRIKVPSNQVAVIDASNTNSLSNGGEMRQGDLMKYKSFERLLNKTFIKMANDLELKIDYSIYNKPKMEVQPEIV